MKKIICVILACVSCFFLFSCNGKTFKAEEFNEEKHTLIDESGNEIIYIDIGIDDLDIGLYNAIYYVATKKDGIKYICPCVVSVSTGTYQNGEKYIRKSVIVNGSVVRYNETREGKEPQWYKYYS